MVYITTDCFTSDGLDLKILYGLDFIDIVRAGFIDIVRLDIVDTFRKLVRQNVGN